MIVIRMHDVQDMISDAKAKPVKSPAMWIFNANIPDSISENIELSIEERFRIKVALGEHILSHAMNCVEGYQALTGHVRSVVEKIRAEMEELKGRQIYPVTALDDFTVEGADIDKLNVLAERLDFLLSAARRFKEAVVTLEVRLMEPPPAKRQYRPQTRAR